MADETLKIPGPDDDGGARRETDESLGWELLFDFRSMVRDLEDRDEIVEVESVVHDPVPQVAAESLVHGLETEVPGYIQQLYFLADGLELRWKLRWNGEIVPGGGFQLFGFATVFGSWVGELWPAGASDDTDSDFLWNLRGFDQHPWNERYTVFCVEDEYPSYDLFLHDPETRESQLLGVDFHSYLDCLLETRGLLGWRLLTVVDELDNSQREMASQCRRRLEHLFPSADLDGISAM